MLKPIYLMLHGNLSVKEEIKQTPKTFPKQLKTKHADLMKKVIY